MHNTCLNMNKLSCRHRAVLRATARLPARRSRAVRRRRSVRDGARAGGPAPAEVRTRESRLVRGDAEDRRKRTADVYSQRFVPRQVIRGSDYYIKWKRWSNISGFFSWAGVSSHVVRFNSDGDAPGRYSVYQYQRFCFEARDECFGYQKIGTWDEMWVIFT